MCLRYIFPFREITGHVYRGASCAITKSLSVSSNCFSFDRFLSFSHLYFPASLSRVLHEQKDVYLTLSRQICTSKRCNYEKLEIRSRRPCLVLITARSQVTQQRATRQFLLQHLRWIDPARNLAARQNLNVCTLYLIFFVHVQRKTDIYPFILIHR